MRRSTRALILAITCAGGLSTALAQTNSDSATKGRTSLSDATRPTANPARRKFDPYQSPLATIMQSHLKADVPEAQDFVRESRPAAKDLKYTPLQSQLGPDPARPKPRDPANIAALQAEMEASIAHNAARVGGHGKPKAHRAKPDAAAN